MLFEMLKFVIDCKDFIIIVWWYVLVIIKYGYVNEFLIKIVL